MSMRLKFVRDGGHRSVEIIEYDFTAGARSFVRFVRVDGETENIEIHGDVFVTNEHGETIDRLKKGSNHGTVRS